jgi:hypothetical protein
MGNIIFGIFLEKTLDFSRISPKSREGYDPYNRKNAGEINVKVAIFGASGGTGLQN